MSRVKFYLLRVTRRGGYPQFWAKEFMRNERLIGHEDYGLRVGVESIASGFICSGMQFYCFYRRFGAVSEL
jgi:hypothetical protein